MLGKFYETSLHEKEEFDNQLNMKDITDADCTHAKKFYKNFEIKALCEQHNLYLQSDTSLLVDVLENFWNKCLKIYELDPAHFLTAPGLAQHGTYKKAKERLDLLTDIDMSLMLGKAIRGGICHAIPQYAKADNKYMEIMIKIKNHQSYVLGCK